MTLSALPLLLLAFFPFSVVSDLQASMSSRAGLRAIAPSGFIRTLVADSAVISRFPTISDSLATLLPDRLRDSACADFFSPWTDSDCDEAVVEFVYENRGFILGYHQEACSFHADLFTSVYLFLVERVPALLRPSEADLERLGYACAYFLSELVLPELRAGSVRLLYSNEYSRRFLMYGIGRGVEHPREKCAQFLNDQSHYSLIAAVTKKLNFPIDVAAASVVLASDLALVLGYGDAFEFSINTVFEAVEQELLPASLMERFERHEVLDSKYVVERTRKLDRLKFGTLALYIDADMNPLVLWALKGNYYIKSLTRKEGFLGLFEAFDFDSEGLQTAMRLYGVSGEVGEGLIGNILDLGELAKICVEEVLEMPNFWYHELTNESDMVAIVGRLLYSRSQRLGAQRPGAQRPAHGGLFFPDILRPDLTHTPENIVTLGEAMAKEDGRPFVFASMHFVQILIERDIFMFKPNSEAVREWFYRVISQFVYFGDICKSNRGLQLFGVLVKLAWHLNYPLRVKLSSEDLRSLSLALAFVTGPGAREDQLHELPLWIRSLLGGMQLVPDLPRTKAVAGNPQLLACLLYASPSFCLPTTPTS